LKKVVPSLIIFLALWSSHADHGLAEPLQGKIDTTKLQGESTGDFIQGGIKNEATINPSLKVIPGQVKKYAPLRAETPQYFYPAGAKLTQYHGASQLPSPDGTRSVPYLPSNVEQYRGGGRVGHPIAPISSYTLTPRIGVMNYHSSGSAAVSSQSGVTSYVPGYEISKVDTHRGISSYVPGTHQVQQVTTHSGIASYDSGHDSKIYHPDMAALAAGHGSIRAVPGPVSKEGITAYAPGYASVPVPVIKATLISNTPGHSYFTPTTSSGMKERVPGYQIEIKTAKNGIVCWDSSYESTVVHPGLIKNTLGGMWFTHENARPVEGDRATTQPLPFKPEYARALVGPSAQPLKAMALGLPGTHVAANTEITWGEWYKRVARAVYSRWQNEDVGPGRATVSVTVTRDRELVGKVVAFTPAPDVERDVTAETSFREAAVKAVNLVSQFEIPEFPPTAEVPSVTFEVVMKRDVDGPVGFDVAAVPGASAGAGAVPAARAIPGAKPESASTTTSTTDGAEALNAETKTLGNETPESTDQTQSNASGKSTNKKKKKGSKAD